MEITLIESGKFLADGGAMFGAIPKAAWSRRYPSNSANQCVLAMRCMLVQTDCGRVILVDNGVGNKQLESLSYYQFFDLVDIADTLRQQGISPEQVTDLVLSHLHFDHCGYTTIKDPDSGKIVPAFPNAVCWVGESQWQNFLHPNALERDSYFPENMLPVQEAGKLRLVTEDTWLCPDVMLRLYKGHTAGQLAVYVYGSPYTVVFAGDVIPLAASVSAEWISAYDAWPVFSYEEKTRMLEEAVREKQVLVYCHDAYVPCTTVKKVNRSFRIDQKIPLQGKNSPQ